MMPFKAFGCLQGIVRVEHSARIYRVGTALEFQTRIEADDIGFLVTLFLTGNIDAA